MVKVSKYIIIFIFLLLNLNASAKVFAELSFSKKEVMVGEKIEVKLVLYSSTWFTDAPVITNFDIPYSIYLKNGENISLVKVIDGKKYSSIEMNYYFFAQRVGEFTLPPIKIKVKSPFEGDYKPQEQVIKTKQNTIRVKDLRSKDFKYFILSPKIYLKEKYLLKKKVYKVGDIIERDIYICAYETLSSLLPEISMEGISWATIYNEEKERETINTGGKLKSISRQRIRYLLKDSGEYVIPSIEIHYYDSYKKKYHSKKLSSYKINVLPNDKLNIARNIPISKDKSQSKLESMYILISILLILLICLLRKKIRLIICKLFKKKDSRKKREIYFFRQISKTNNYAQKYTKFNFWYFNYFSKENNISNSLKDFGDEELNCQYEELQKASIGEEHNFSNKRFYSRIKRMRRVHQKKTRSDRNKLKPLYS